jgi:hypothetical protein
MQVAAPGQHYVLALYASTQGMAYMLFEGPLSLVDWGKTAVSGAMKNDRCTDTARNLVERYVPDVIILEDTSRRASKRSVRIRMLNRAFAALGTVNGVDVLQFGPKDVRATFDSLGAKTKHERAKVIVSMLPALSHRLPPKRKPWMSEDPRMAIFEAAALGLAYYGQH